MSGHVAQWDLVCLQLACNNCTTKACSRIQRHWVFSGIRMYSPNVFRVCTECSLSGHSIYSENALFTCKYLLSKDDILPYRLLNARFLLKSHLYKWCTYKITDIFQKTWRSQMSQISKCPNITVILTYWEPSREVSELRYKTLLFDSSRWSYCIAYSL